MKATENIRKEFKVVFIILAVVVLSAAITGFALYSRAKASTSLNVAAFTVAQGALTISVTETGSIQPLNQVIIKSEVEGTNTIIYLIEEGTKVKKGDLLLELDASSLSDTKLNQEISLKKAESSYITAKENFEVVKNQSESNIEQAELDKMFAAQDLEKYINGEFPNKVMELESYITLAQEELERAQDDYEWSKKLFQEKYISESQLKSDELTEKKAQLDLELAKSNLELFKSFTHKRSLAALESNVKQANMALERTMRSASADNIQAQAELVAKEAEFNREKGKLEKIIFQLAKTKIYAPIDGLVVYATSVEASAPHRSVTPLDEGVSVRERQELIYLPTGSDFKAQIKVHESSLEKIQVGLPVRITVGALPGVEFSGKVTSIAPFPDAQSMFMNPDLKLYITVINVDDKSNLLRSGMSCSAEIMIAHYASATYIPIQSVTKVNGKPTVYVIEGGMLNPRTVETGLDNNRMIRILGGLKTGEKVVLAPPITKSSSEQGQDGTQDSNSRSEFDTTKNDGPDSSPEVRSDVSSKNKDLGVTTNSEPNPADTNAVHNDSATLPLDPLTMTDEDREKMKAKIDKMTPEERKKFFDKMPRPSGAPMRPEGR